MSIESPDVILDRVFAPIDTSKYSFLKNKIINDHKDFFGDYYVYKYDEDAFKEEEDHLKIIELLLEDKNNLSLAIDAINDLLIRIKNAMDYLEELYYKNTDLEEIDEKTKKYAQYSNYLTNQY